LSITVAHLQRGQKAIIRDFNIDEIREKLLGSGGLPGNEVMFLHVAPFCYPLSINVNDSHVAIRLETAKEISIEIINVP